MSFSKLTLCGLHFPSNNAWRKLTTGILLPAESFLCSIRNLPRRKTLYDGRSRNIPKIRYRWALDIALGPFLGLRGASQALSTGVGVWLDRVCSTLDVGEAVTL